MKGFFRQSIGRKIAMSLSAFFLMFFLIMHLSVNMMSVVSEDLFNTMSHFMGTNPIVQGVLQPVLLIGVIFHFVMGFYLELKNNKARTVSYAKKNAGASSSWMSRNMIISGAVILAFLVLHFIDFWFPEMNTKYIVGDMSGMLHDGTMRYYEELHHKFANPLRVVMYVVSFVFLSLHLMHGFTSAFQSMGASVGRTKIMKTIGNIYSILIPLGFIVVALFHFFTQSH